MKLGASAVVILYVDCLDDAQAAEFLEGVMPAPEARRVETHIAECSGCRKLVAALARALSIGGDVGAIAATELAAVEPADSSDAQTTVPERPRAPAAVPAPAPGLLRAGDKVARYVILECLGVGGMGMVYAAYDPRLDRRVALKFIRDRAAGGPDATERLVREAQAAAKLAHPNAVAVYDVGTVAEQVYIAMEHIDGCTLTEWLLWPRRWRDVVDTFVAAGRGLAAAHERGIVHRDFKPDNVMVCKSGRVRVMDFGLARVEVAETGEGAAPREATASERLTQTGAVLGTPRFMAPEQFRGGPVGAAADQFGFCAALFAALYGVPPFRAGTAARLAGGASLDAELLPVPEGSSVPAWLHPLLVRGLAPRPEDRHPSLASLLDALASGLAPSVQRRPPWWFSPVVAVAVAALGWFGYDRFDAEAQARRAAEQRESAALGQFESAQGEAAALRGEIDALVRELGDLRSKERAIRAVERDLGDKLQRLEQLRAAPDKRTRTKALVGGARFAEPLDSRLVARRIFARRSAIELCYRRGLRNNPLMAGWVESEFAIAADGSVSWADVRKLRDFRTAECIEAELARIRFPRSEVGTLATYNFYFAPHGAGADLEVAGGETESGEGVAGPGPLGFRCTGRDPLCGVD